MRPRDFIAGLGAVTWPLAARARFSGLREHGGEMVAAWA